MRVVNRTAVTLVGAKPFIDWTLATDADASKGAVTVARAKTFGSAFLLPELDWFRIDIHNVVVDVADDDIEGEEL